MEKLFIIGNGFDIAHDLKTDYLYFKKFVYQQAYGKDELLESLQTVKGICDFFREKDIEIQEQHRCGKEDELRDIYGYSLSKIRNGQLDKHERYQFIYRHMMQLMGLENFWSQFEHDLGWINEVKIIPPSYVLENLETYSEELATILEKFLIADIENLFREWVQCFILDWDNMPSNLKKLKRKKSVEHNKNAYFLTFNYSMLLENFYGINYEQICHIHGSISENKLIFGHNREMDSYDESIQNDPTAVRDLLYNLVDLTRKPVHRQLRKHESFFKSLSSIKEIYFIGFGIRDENGVDAPYFKEIFKQAPDVSIYIDQFDKENEYTIKKILKAWGAHNAYQLQFIDTNKDEIVGGDI